MKENKIKKITKIEQREKKEKMKLLNSFLLKCTDRHANLFIQCIVRFSYCSKSQLNETPWLPISSGSQ